MIIFWFLIPLIPLSYKFYQLREEKKENLQKIANLEKQQKQTQEIQIEQKVQIEIEKLKQKEIDDKRLRDGILIAAATCGFGFISTAAIKAFDYQISHSVSENQRKCPNEPLIDVVAGSKNPTHDHVVASERWGRWKPEKGYDWKITGNENKCNLEVIKK